MRNVSSAGWRAGTKQAGQRLSRAKLFLSLKSLCTDIFQKEKNICLLNGKKLGKSNGLFHMLFQCISLLYLSSLR